MPRGPNVLLSLSERGPLYGFCAYAKPTELIFSRQSRLTTPTRGVLSQRCQHTQSPPRCRYPARTFRRRFSQNPTKNSTASGFQTSTHAHEKSEAPAPLRPIVLTPIENALKTLFIDVAQSIRGRKLREGASGADIPKLELRFVGGWVRDKLRGRDTEDIDLGIAGMNSYDFCYAVRDYLSDPQRWEKYQAMIPSPKFQPGPVGVHRMRGNVRNTNYAGACLSNIFGLYVDIVSFQKPTGPGRPISPLDALKMDAFRLDATINTLHYNLTTSEVEDLTGKGLRDLRHGVIRTPLSPYDTLAYDPIRILRLIRFASEPRYHIERNTKHGMRNGLILMSFKTDPMPRRVTVELNKILRGLWLQISHPPDYILTAEQDPIKRKLWN